MVFKQLRAYLALCQVARRNGISVKQVIREIPCKGEIPTALELVAHMAERMTE